MTDQRGPKPPVTRESVGTPTTLALGAAVAWRFLVVVAAIWVIVWMLARVEIATLPLALAVILATLFVPPERWLERHHVRPALATFAVLAAALLAVAGVFTFLIPRFVAQLGTLQSQLRTAVQRLGTEFGLQVPALDLGQLSDRAVNLARNHAGDILREADTLLRVGTGLLLAVVLLFFLVKDRRQISDWLLHQVPADWRAPVRAVAFRGWHALGGYIHGLVLVATIDAIGVGIGLFVIGVPLVFSLMILTFLGAMIPVIGTFTAGLVSVLIGFVSGGITDAALVLGVILLVQAIEDHVLHPVIMRRIVRLHPVVVLLAITAGTVLRGIVGAFLAVPIAASLSAMGNEVRVQRASTTGTSHADSPVVSDAASA